MRSPTSEHIRISMISSLKSCRLLSSMMRRVANSALQNQIFNNIKVPEVQRRLWSLQHRRDATKKYCNKCCSPRSTEGKFSTTTSVIFINTLNESFQIPFNEVTSFPIKRNKISLLIHHWWFNHRVLVE